MKGKQVYVSGVRGMLRAWLPIKSYGETGMTHQKQISPIRHRTRRENGELTDERLINTLLETQEMVTRLKLQLNWAVDEVFKDVIIEPGRARFANEDHEGLLQALYQLYIERYGHDPAEDEP